MKLLIKSIYLVMKKNFVIGSDGVISRTVQLERKEFNELTSFMHKYQSKLL